MSIKTIDLTPVAKSIPFSNVGNGFTATNVQTAIEEAKNIDTIIYVNDISTQTTTSTTYANITNMTSTPASGTYFVIFNGHATTSGASSSGLFALALAGSIQTDSVREISSNLILLGGLVTISTNTIGCSMTCVSKITANGSQAITAQFKSTAGGTINIQEKSLTLLKVG